MAISDGEDAPSGTPYTFTQRYVRARACTRRGFLCLSNKRVPAAHESNKYNDIGRKSRKITAYKIGKVLAMLARTHNNPTLEDEISIGRFKLDELHVFKCNGVNNTCCSDACMSVYMIRISIRISGSVVFFHRIRSSHRAVVQWWSVDTK